MAFMVSHDPEDGRVFVGSSDRGKDGLATAVVRGADGIWRAEVPSADASALRKSLASSAVMTRCSAAARLASKPLELFEKIFRISL